MADDIVLTRSVQNGVAKLSFDQQGGGWRVVMERPGAAEKTRHPEVVTRYASKEEAWKDVTAYMNEGFKIVLITE